MTAENSVQIVGGSFPDVIVIDHESNLRVTITPPVRIFGTNKIGVLYEVVSLDKPDAKMVVIVRKSEKGGIEVETPEGFDIHSLSGARTMLLKRADEYISAARAGQIIDPYNGDHEKAGKLLTDLGLTLSLVGA